jgi:GTP cyclohydrolase II
MLKALGLSRVRLLSNNPEKVEPHPYVEEYFRTKKEKLGHLFSSS